MRALALLALFLTSCAAAAPPLPCAGFAPIILDAGALERLTPSEKAQIDAHNSFGAQHCGWVPP